MLAALQGLYTVDILIGNHETLIVRSNESNKKYIQLGLGSIQNNKANKILQSPLKVHYHLPFCIQQQKLIY